MDLIYSFNEKSNIMILKNYLKKLLYID